MGSKGTRKSALRHPSKRPSTVAKPQHTRMRHPHLGCGPGELLPAAHPCAGVGRRGALRLLLGCGWAALAGAGCRAWPPRLLRRGEEACRQNRKARQGEVRRGHVGPAWLGRLRRWGAAAWRPCPPKQLRSVLRSMQRDSARAHECLQAHPCWCCACPAGSPNSKRSMQP